MHLLTDPADLINAAIAAYHLTAALRTTLHVASAMMHVPRFVLNAAIVASFIPIEVSSIPRIPYPSNFYTVDGAGFDILIRHFLITFSTFRHFRSP
jgi:hypothetical protein